MIKCARKKWVDLKLVVSQKSSGNYAHRADARFTALRRCAVVNRGKNGQNVIF